MAYNSISRVADGVSYPERNVDIYGNEIFDVSDDGLEPDYGFANVRMWGNRITNAKNYALSFQPMKCGPWYFVRNVCVGTGGIFKFRVQDRFALINNTFVKWGSIGDRMHHILSSYSRNNLYISADGKGPIWTAYDCNQPQYCLPNNYEPSWMTDVDYDGFDWGDSPEAFRWSNHRKRFNDLTTFVAAVGIEQHGMRVRKEEIFEKWEIPSAPSRVAPQNLPLKEGSTALDAGIVVPNISDSFVGKAPDLGAYELGGQTPHYGPRREYLPSEIIADFTIHPERTSVGNGDNWPITWADDGHQYTVYCDGEGFGGGSGQGSMSLARIVGDPPDFNGVNLRSPTAHKTGGDVQGRKASGLLMVDGVLYMWVRNLNKDGSGASLAWSEDRAATWTWADWNFPEVGYPTWLNAGKDYSAAQDGYAYAYSPDTPSAYKASDHMILARVKKAEIRDKEAYRFFAGLDCDGNPKWEANFERRKPVFTDPGRCYRPEVVFNPGIGRYLLCTATSGSARWCGTDEKYLGIFDAPTPWGPWSVVKQIHGWGGDENRFQPRIPPKWISEDGKTVYLLYSCFPKGLYQFNVQKCSLELSERAGP